MYAKINSLGIFGLDGYPVIVETDVSTGLPAFDVVGLPDAAVSEARGRVRAAIKNSRHQFPPSRITVNLAPADKRKIGSYYDLPIFLSILLATNQLRFPVKDIAFLGELSLEGSLRPISGALPMAIAAKEAGFTSLVLPYENMEEASVVEGLSVIGAKDVTSLLAHLVGDHPLPGMKVKPYAAHSPEDLPDFRDIKGQLMPRRALEIAAAGGHNLLMIGPPGSGKSMLAKRLPSIMPSMSYEEVIETTKIYSVANALYGRPLITTRPFRAPHHTVSPAGLTGGGSIPKPGEISLSHNGILFLDELPEFSRNAMEVLRQPIEDDIVTISRASASLTYPCLVMFVAAMNPCPCGNFGVKDKSCNCPPYAIERYLSRISGPLLDRIDLHIEVQPVEYSEIAGTGGGESSDVIRARVVEARAIQQARFSGTSVRSNAKIPSSRMDELCAMTDNAKQVMRRAFSALHFSARAYDKVRKIARTIADLSCKERIESEDIAEAVMYRALDKKYWNR